MNLAPVLVFFGLSLGITGVGSLPDARLSALQEQSASPAPRSSSQTQSSQPPGNQPQTSATPAKPAPRHRKKKTATPPCPDPKTCPPAKVVVKNGGSDASPVQLKGNTTAEQESQQRSSTEQLTAATEEKLKKVADRQLTDSQQEMLNQAKQFIQQSKEAVAAGDLERGRSLALKADLLSDELAKP